MTENAQLKKLIQEVTEFLHAPENDQLFTQLRVRQLLNELHRVSLEPEVKFHPNVYFIVMDDTINPKSQAMQDFKKWMDHHYTEEEWEHRVKEEHSRVSPDLPARWLIELIEDTKKSVLFKTEPFVRVVSLLDEMIAEVKRLDGNPDATERSELDLQWTWSLPLSLPAYMAFRSWQVNRRERAAAKV